MEVNVCSSYFNVHFKSSNNLIDVYNNILNIKSHTPSPDTLTT